MARHYTWSAPEVHQRAGKPYYTYTGRDITEWLKYVTTDPKKMPHQGAREMARRRRRIACVGQ